MSSQITHTHTHTHTVVNIHPLAHILEICALVFSNCAISIVYPNRIIRNRIPPLSRLQTPEHGRAVRKNTDRAKQKWPRETHSATYAPGLSTLSDLSRIDA